MENWETYQRFGLPIVDGGLIDQPFVIMLQMETAASEMEAMKYIQEIQDSK